MATATSSEDQLPLPTDFGVPAVEQSGVGGPPPPPPPPGPCQVLTFVPFVCDTAIAQAHGLQRGHRYFVSEQCVDGKKVIGVPFVDQDGMRRLCVRMPDGSMTKAEAFVESATGLRKWRANAGEPKSPTGTCCHLVGCALADHITIQLNLHQLILNCNGQAAPPAPNPPFVGTVAAIIIGTANDLISLYRYPGGPTTGCNGADLSQFVTGDCFRYGTVAYGFAYTFNCGPFCPPIPGGPCGHDGQPACLQSSHASWNGTICAEFFLTWENCVIGLSVPVTFYGAFESWNVGSDGEIYDYFSAPNTALGLFSAFASLQTVGPVPCSTLNAQAAANWQLNSSTPSGTVGCNWPQSGPFEAYCAGEVYNCTCTDDPQPWSILFDVDPRAIGPMFVPTA